METTPQAINISNQTLGSQISNSITSSINSSCPKSTKKFINRRIIYNRPLLINSSSITPKINKKLSSSNSNDSLPINCNHFTSKSIKSSCKNCNEKTQICPVFSKDNLISKSSFFQTSSRKRSAPIEKSNKNIEIENLESSNSSIDAISFDKFHIEESLEIEIDKIYSPSAPPPSPNGRNKFYHNENYEISNFPNRQDSVMSNISNCSSASSSSSAYSSMHERDNILTLNYNIDDNNIFINTVKWNSESNNLENLNPSIQVQNGEDNIEEYNNEKIRKLE